MIPYSDEPLSSGLSHDNYEAAQLAAAFWEIVWPKLVECGWEKKVSAMKSVLEASCHFRK